MPQVEREGVRLFYREDGVGGTPLLLVHGWCCDHRYMPDLLDYFAPGRRTIAVDLRGHGQSDRPVGDYSMAVLADDLAFLCGELGIDRTVVVGHSLGGMVALALVQRRPELVAGAVMLDSPVIRPAALLAAREKLLADLRGPEFLDVARRYVEAMFLPTDEAHLRSSIVDAMLSAPQHVMVAALDGSYRFDAAVAARGCRAPALFVAATPPRCDVARLREACPHFTFGETVGAGHFHQLLVPDQVNAMVERFLAINGL